MYTADAGHYLYTLSSPKSGRGHCFGMPLLPFLSFGPYNSWMCFVLFQANKDTTTITTHNDVHDIDIILSSCPTLAFCECVDFVKYPWLIEKVNTTQPFTPHNDNKPAVPFESWKDAMCVDPLQWKVLTEDLEVHVKAQKGVSSPLLLLLLIRAREADVIMLMWFSLAPWVSLLL